MADVSYGSAFVLIVAMVGCLLDHFVTLSSLNKCYLPLYIFAKTLGYLSISAEAVTFHIVG